MKQIDIIGVGTRVIFIGKVTGNKYEGLMFYKKGPRNCRFPDNYFLIDIKDLVDDQIISSHGIELFKNATFSLNDIKGEYYAIFERKVQFGRFLQEDDFI